MPPALCKTCLFSLPNKQTNETDDETDKQIFSFQSHVFMRAAHGETCDWDVRFFATALSLSWKVDAHTSAKDKYLQIEIVQIHFYISWKVDTNKNAKTNCTNANTQKQKCISMLSRHVTRM